MKLGEITEPLELFSYQNQRFSDQKFIICVRDDRFEHNVKTLIAVDNKELVDLDPYQFDNNLYTTKPPYNNPRNIEDLPISRFHLNELIKIDNGTIIENIGAEYPNMPKVKTFNENIHPFATNQIIELFDGEINENDSVFKPLSNGVFEIIKNVYVESENCFFVIAENSLVGPFKALKVNGNSFNISKSAFMQFGKYDLDENSYFEFEANNICRKVYLREVNSLTLKFIKDYDFISNDELLNEFEKELISNSNYFNESNLSNVLSILKKATEVDKIETKIKNNSRLKEILNKGEKILNKDIDLLRSIPEIQDLKVKREKIEEELLIYRNELDEIKRQTDKLLDDKSNLLEDKSNLLEEISNLEETKTAEL